MNLLRTLKRAPRAWLPETLAYSDRITANGGSIAESSLDAINKFIAACKTAGIWDKFIEVGPFAGSNLSAALVKLVYPNGGSAVLTNVNFVSGDYAETGSNGGLAADGTKFLNTGFQGTSLPDTGHFSFYLREDVTATGNRSMIGAVAGTDQYWMGALQASLGVDLRYGGIIDANGGASFPKGFYTGVRESTTSLTYYRDASSIGTNNSSASTTKPAFPVYLFAFNSSGTASAKLIARGSFYSIGQALNATEVTALHNAVRNLQSALNRAVN